LAGGDAALQRAARGAALAGLSGADATL